MEVTVSPQVSGGGGAGMAGNVLFGGLIGAAVDAGSGAMHDLVPNPVDVRMVPLNLGDMDTGGLPPDERLRRLQELRNNGDITAKEYRRKRDKILRQL